MPPARRLVAAARTRRETIDESITAYRTDARAHRRGVRALDGATACCTARDRAADRLAARFRDAHRGHPGARQSVPAADSQTVAAED